MHLEALEHGGGLVDDIPACAFFCLGNADFIPVDHKRAACFGGPFHVHWSLRLEFQYVIGSCLVSCILKSMLLPGDHVCNAARTQHTTLVPDSRLQRSFAHDDQLLFIRVCMSSMRHKAGLESGYVYGKRGKCSC